MAEAKQYNLTGQDGIEVWRNLPEGATILTPEFTRNHFELLGLPLAYAVDPSRLESGYRHRG